MIATLTHYGLHKVNGKNNKILNMSSAIMFQINPDKHLDIIYNLHQVLDNDNATWWRHKMETFSALLAIYAGNSPVPGEFPTQRPVMRSFDIFFDLRLNKRSSKQSWGWWFIGIIVSIGENCVNLSHINFRESNTNVIVCNY